MLEKIAPFGLASFVIVALAFAVATLHSQFRMKRHLRRLRTVPLDKWSVRG